MLRDISPKQLTANLFRDYDDDQGIDLTQAVNDVASVVIPFPCILLKTGMVITETCAGSTTTPIVKADIRPTAGSDTDRGDGDAGEIACSTTAAGIMVYDEAGHGTALEPGQEIVFQLTQKAEGSGDAAGHGFPVVLVKPDPQYGGDLDGAEETD